MTVTESAAISLLIVEDNDVEREGLSAVLRFSGFGTREAANGMQALDSLRTQKPDAILLDMLLSGHGDDGWSILRQLRTKPEWSGVPIIIVTGLQIASQEWAHSLGAEAVVHKPVDTVELIGRIKAAVP
jgi:CheY-like chemotaxis protein